MRVSVPPHSVNFNRRLHSESFSSAAPPTFAPLPTAGISFVKMNGTVANCVINVVYREALRDQVSGIFPPVLKIGL